MKFTLINGTKKEKVNYNDIYDRIFTRLLNKAASELKLGDTLSQETSKKLVLFGVKMFNSSIDNENNTYEDLIEKLNTFELINKTICSLTPMEFQSIFPISKEYDGEKYGFKDYFYTKDHISKIGENNKIDDANLFLWEYQNHEIAYYITDSLSLLSDIRRFQGKKGLLEEFFEGKGISMQTKTKNIKGQDVLIDDETGKEIVLKKKQPSYLKLV